MTEDPLSEVNGPSVSDHRGTEGVHLATVKGEADRANMGFIQNACKIRS